MSRNKFEGKTVNPDETRTFFLDFQAFIYYLVTNLVCFLGHKVYLDNNYPVYKTALIVKTKKKTHTHTRIPKSVYGR